MAIVLDAMGGDFAPGKIIQGALRAASEGVYIYLTGPRDELTPLVAGAKAVEIVHAPDRVAMSESPADVIRKKPESSLMVGARLAKEKGIPLVSAGNTGACMAAALFTFGRIKGIKRPPIASVFPGIEGGRTIILDVGANVDCSSENLMNFALMGAAYATAIFGIKKPSIGLLSNGGEAEKGNALTLETYKCLQESNLNFIGNVEGYHVLSGKCDVIVTDGFSGNILLKTAEGVTRSLLRLVHSSLSAPESQPLLATQSLLAKLEVFNPSSPEHSGAPLLGINGSCFIVHGNADEKTTYGACLASEKLGRSGIVKHIADELEKKRS
jgi:phosphate acyltransferase